MSDGGHLEAIGAVAAALTAVGTPPVMVGGMALVVLGSQRVTRDFDFVVAHPGDRLAEVVELLYARGFELAARLDEHGDITATIAHPPVATAKLRVDAPVNASFLNRATRLRLDLLFDFPIAAADLAARATRRKIRSLVMMVAAEEDLLHLKRLALNARGSARDAQDVAFLERRLARQ